VKIAVAMSGGVDSSVAAGLLLEQGHEVVGVTLQQWPRSDAAELERHGGCCSLNAVEDARRVAALLGVPYYCWNLEAEFGERVIEPFHRAYLAGETPNPCLRCNAFVRFDLMLNRVLGLGFDALATGHYARVLEGPDGPELHAANDAGKDQKPAPTPGASACRWPRSPRARRSASSHAAARRSIWRGGFRSAKASW